MNGLGKIRVGFVLRKEPKNRGKSTKIPLREGGFLEKTKPKPKDSSERDSGRGDRRQEADTPDSSVNGTRAGRYYTAVGTRSYRTGRLARDFPKKGVFAKRTHLKNAELMRHE